MGVLGGNEGRKPVMNGEILIEIFDPPMCCPGGMCGPAVDPAILDVHEAILKIKKEYDGAVRVERYLLTQQGAKFMQNAEVLARLKAQGTSVLPVTAVNGRVVKDKAFPSYDEFKSWIAEGESA